MARCQLDSNRGIGFITRALCDAGVPVLDLPVDPVDARTWDDDKMRTLVADFIENTLEPIKNRIYA